MKKISKLLRYNDLYLDPKIPDEAKFLGNTQSDYPFFIQEGVLPEKVCDAIVQNLLGSGEQGDLEISQQEDQKEGSTLNAKVRDTQYFKMNVNDKSFYKKALEKMKPQIETFFDLKLSNSEGLQTLGYKTGGHYKLHADNCYPHFKDQKFSHWELTKPYRKITTILFLTEAVLEVEKIGQHIGGNLSFDYLQNEDAEPFLLEPKKGMFLAFPSNPYFSHTVYGVLEGFRVSLVEWHDAEYN